MRSTTFGCPLLGEMATTVDMSIVGLALGRLYFSPTVQIRMIWNRGWDFFVCILRYPFVLCLHYLTARNKLYTGSVHLNWINYFYSKQTTYP